MANKKTVKPPVTIDASTPEVNPEVVEEVLVGQTTDIKEQPEVSEETPKAKNQTVTKEITEKTVEEKELPDYAKRVLKIFCDQPELYITAKGGAFPPTAKPSERGSAILYKNPYYKS